MDLGNLVEIIRHYLLIREITCLGHRGEFSMVNALVCTVIHWTRTIVNPDARLSVFMIDQVTLLHGHSTLREY